jgi:hypothetical protein
MTTAATLADALGREPSIEEVAVPILESLREVTQSVGTFELDSEVEADLARLRVAYDDAAWTWRR